MHYSLVPDQIAYYRRMASRPKRFNATSKYKGVSLSYNNKWTVRISFKGRSRYIGVYDTEDEAARMYNKHALEIIGPGAIFNDVPDSN